ncbi:MAG: YgjV family protein [Candidatus Gracilibacteria bacterium]|nr:YgjV family protein [Candidatus Gracilibacteria bacterium]
MKDFFLELFNMLTSTFLANPLGQIIGLIAFFVSIYNFLYCKNKRFIFFTMIASIFWGFHFLALGLLSAAYINIVDVLKNALALKYEKNKYMTLGFISIYVIISYFTYEGIISLIPLATAILSTILVFYVRGVYLNIGFLFVIVLWMIYNLIGGSIGGFMTDSTLMITGIIGIYKIIKSENKKEVNKIIKKEKKILESID